ncbi:MAG: 16S rRNA (guanine(527)-N(7))-methyltransferase RsmG [Lachnospiraceae bacterium]|nr:16S rRNA (guanine(527)-N(7))-methyltransferase RsmG [Lachnospiraceae bacterium]
MEKTILDQFEREAAAWGITISETQKEQFSDYASLLVEWNERINLTRITEPTAICRQHFLDSIAPMRFVSFADRSLIDIGTGAGFPGIPLKIVNPSLRLTLLDALEKRCRFLQEVVDRLGLDDDRCVSAQENSGKPTNKDPMLKEAGSVRILHGRAEEFATTGTDSLRGQFDLATSRAVAKLNILCEYAIPYLKTGGQFLAYKLEDAEEELTGAKNALAVLDATCIRREFYTLPEVTPGHGLFFIEKTGETPAKYPRRAGMPEKKPL